MTASTSNGTATSPGDYTANSQTLTFTSAQTSKTFTVATTEDSVAESTETMNVTLSNPSNGTTIADGSAIGTITDDDTAPPANLAIGNASVTEGGTLSFTVTRSGTTTTAVSAHYATAGGTATSGSDFTAKSGTVSFAANQTTATITVSTTDDSTSESAETMTVTLSSPSSGAAITTATGTGTINDNDGNIILTTTGAPYYMGVLSQYSSVYGCQGGSPMGNTYEVCFVIGVGQVYNSAGSPTFAAGYSLTANGELQVDAAHYGTAQ